MRAMADEAKSRYAKTQQHGAVTLRILSHRVRSVTHGDLFPPFENDMVLMLLEDGLRLRHTLEFLMLSYLPHKETRQKCRPLWDY
jgi:hypothetical protein